ncbi:MAG: hypothetical protein MUO57_14790 [Anaerolineales bacterium]|nr:hypothetical protein [Anaerolineales bacterium]
MIKIHRLPILAVAAIALAMLACNYPFVTSPTPIVFPTPDLTMTALFNPTLTSIAVIFPTQTMPPAWSSPTATPPGLQSTLIPTNTPLPPTATATNTPTATRSYAGPGMRPKFSMLGVYFKSPPRIDASLEEWHLDRYRIESVVFGKSNHKGENDLSGRAMVGWDEQNLYLGIRVIDEKYVQNTSGSNLYKGDSLDILLDTDVSSDFYLADLNHDDYQLGISPGSPSPNEKPEAYLWFPESIESARDQIEIASRSRGDGYIVEAAIPWSVFDVKPFNGQHFGFAFSISDNDNPNQNIQESMVSYVPIRTLNDPTTWGDLTLIKP